MRRPVPLSPVSIAAGTALVLAAVAFWAAPAAAHAVLLRSEPSPQATVATPPAAVRLVFSEAVEGAFGAVRVFDVDGARVDEGRIRMAAGGEEVIVPARLSGGTYTVVWRVLSIDGHSIRGGFQFYVGAPSTISPVPVELDGGASWAVTWGYGAVRFLWYGSLLALVGLVVIRQAVWTPAVRAAGLAGSPAQTHFEQRFTGVLPWAWTVLLLGWTGRLVFQAASISGLGLADSARPGVVREMLATGFGRSWVAGLGFAILAGVAVGGLAGRAARTGRPGPRDQTWVSLLGAATVGLALATANMGHARTESLPELGVPAAAVHLLAAAAWVGGLAALVLLGSSVWAVLPGEERRRLVGQVVGRFSRVAFLAVAVLVATGAINSFLDLASVTDLWRTTHGRVLTAKIGLLAVALAFGAWHRWIVPRRLAAGDGGAAGRSLLRSTAVELVLLTAVVGFASALVALVPGRSLAEEARGPVNLEEQVGAYTVQLFVDPSRAGANEIHLTFVDADGFGAGEVTAVTARLEREDGPGGAAPLAVRLISAGHFVGQEELDAGPYRLTVEVPSVSPPAATSFEFELRSGPAAGG